jgi:tetratricopeptide (TPR) repeat protein
MLKFINSLLLSSLILIFACGSKKDIVLEDETAESLLEKSQVAYQKGEYDKTLRYIDLLLNNFPTSDLHIDAQLLQSQTLGALEKFEDQFDLLLRILKENIIPERVPQIYMQLGAFYEDAAKWNPGNVSSDTLDLQEAAKYYRKAVFYPNSDDRATKAAALYRAALMYARIKDIDTAKKAYAQVIETFPESPYSSLARTKLLNPANTEELPLEAALESTASAPSTPAVSTPETAAEEGVQDILVPVEEDTAQFQLPPETPDEEPVSLDSLQTTIPDTIEQYQFEMN